MRKLLLIVVPGAALLVLGYFIGNSNKNVNPKNEYPFLSKRILVENQNDIIVNFIPLRQAVKQYFKKNSIEHSFFFEYLPSGVSIRDDEDNQLIGASLLKLPIIISLYGAAEKGIVSLDKQVKLEPVMLDDKFGNLWQKGAGYQLSLREAARLGLVDSDNTAVNVISSQLKNIGFEPEYLLRELDIDISNNIPGRTKISARNYSSILRCLYLSCYLSKDNSQTVLQQMSQSSAYGRIGSGLPSGVVNAHKIGVFGNETQSDCSIVYVPNRPYTLCIILNTNETEAARHMQALSQMIYSYVADEDK